MHSARGLDGLLARGGLSVLFQPVVKVGTDHCHLHSVESLVRGPQGSTLESAEILFDYVRRKRQEAVVDRACVEAILQGVARLPSTLAFSINVHAASLSKDPEFVGFVADSAKARSIPLSRMVLEIVEHAPEWADTTLGDALDALRHMGVGIALDDIGLGQSNYQMILDCKPDYFKIDRYLVHGCHGDFYRQAVLDSVSHLARKFGAQVIAEGVEDAADLRTVRDLGIELVQGYLFCRAVSGPDLATRLPPSVPIPGAAVVPAHGEGAGERCEPIRIDG